jgi:zinc D-Ala-D-Ala carboxypeptidase
MKLSKYFTLDEMTRSQTASQRNILNVPNDTQIENLIELCICVLDRIRETVSRPVMVTSGYRSNLLNKAVGGSRTSQHLQGQAADIQVKGMKTEQLFQLILKSGIEFDQCIQEFDTWVHISFNEGDNRNQALRAIKRNGQTVFIPVRYGNK